MKRRYVVTIEIPEECNAITLYALEEAVNDYALDYVSYQLGRDLHDDEVVVDVARVDE